MTEKKQIESGRGEIFEVKNGSLLCVNLQYWSHALFSFVECMTKRIYFGIKNYTLVNFINYSYFIRWPLNTVFTLGL